MSGMLAKVLNSSVGTSDFKPLDEVLMSKVRLIGTDDVFYKYDGEWTNDATNGQYNKYTSKYIQFDIEGAVWFKVTFSNGVPYDWGYDTSVGIKVKDANGKVLGEDGVIVHTVQSATTTYELSVAINVTKGTKYRVETSSSKKDSYLYAPTDLTVCATPVLSTGKCTLTT